MIVTVFGERASDLRKRFGLDEGDESVEVLLSLRNVEGRDVVDILI